MFVAANIVHWKQIRICGHCSIQMRLCLKKCRYFVNLVINPFIGRIDISGVKFLILTIDNVNCGAKIRNTLIMIEKCAI